MTPNEREIAVSIANLHASRGRILNLKKKQRTVALTEMRSNGGALNISRDRAELGQLILLEQSEGEQSVAAAVESIKKELNALDKIAKDINSATLDAAVSELAANVTKVYLKPTGKVEDFLGTSLKQITYLANSASSIRSAVKVAMSTTLTVLQTLRIDTKSKEPVSEVLKTAKSKKPMTAEEFISGVTKKVEAANKQPGIFQKALTFVKTLGKLPEPTPFDATAFVRELVNASPAAIAQASSSPVVSKAGSTGGTQVDDYIAKMAKSRGEGDKGGEGKESGKPTPEAGAQKIADDKELLKKLIDALEKIDSKLGADPKSIISAIEKISKGTDVKAAESNLDPAVKSAVDAALKAASDGNVDPEEIAKQVKDGAAANKTGGGDASKEENRDTWTYGGDTKSRKAALKFAVQQRNDQDFFINAMKKVDSAFLGDKSNDKYKIPRAGFLDKSAAEDFRRRAEEAKKDLETADEKKKPLIAKFIKEMEETVKFIEDYEKNKESAGSKENNSAAAKPGADAAPGEDKATAPKAEKAAPAPKAAKPAAKKDETAAESRYFLSNGNKKTLVELMSYLSSSYSRSSQSGKSTHMSEKRAQFTDVDVINEMRSVYMRRLNEALRGLNEVEIQDKQGNIILSPGLKVRHKKSKFEYTVHSIDSAAESVRLLSPETPRVMEPQAKAQKNFKMPSESELLKLLNGKIEIPADFFSDDHEDLASRDSRDKSSHDDDIIDVSFTDFTKNYEVTE